MKIESNILFFGLRGSGAMGVVLLCCSKPSSVFETLKCFIRIYDFVLRCFESSQEHQISPKGGSMLSQGIKENGSGRVNVASGIKKIVWGLVKVVSGRVNVASGIKKMVSGRVKMVSGIKKIVSGRVMMLWGIKKMINGRVNMLWGKVKVSSGRVRVASGLVKSRVSEITVCKPQEIISHLNNKIIPATHSYLLVADLKIFLMFPIFIKRNINFLSDGNDDMYILNTNSFSGFILFLFPFSGVEKIFTELRLCANFSPCKRKKQSRLNSSKANCIEYSLTNKGDDTVAKLFKRLFAYGR